MKKLLAGFLLFFLLHHASGQGSFLKTIDTTNFGRNVRTFQTNDQGMAVFSLDSLKLYKFDRCGEPEWAKQYNIPIGPYVGNIIKTQSGGFALLNRIPSGNIYHSVITLLSASGTVIWSKSLEDPNYIQFPYTISEDNSGNFVVLANAAPLNQQGYFNAITKIDANGNFLWTKFYEFGPIWGGATLTSDNGIVARIGSAIFKTDNTGNIQWSCRVSPTSHYLAPIEVNDGFIITGITPTNKTSFHKLDFLGNQVWGGLKTIDYAGLPPLLYKKSTGNFAAVFNKTISGQNYATIIEFDKDLNIVRHSTLNNLKAGFMLQGLNVGFSDENHTLLAGLVIANAAGSKLFFAKTDNLFHTGCDTTFTITTTTEPTTHTIIPSTRGSYTFQVVNKPYTVQSIPAATTTLCSNFTPATLNIHADSFLCAGAAGLTLKDISGSRWSSYLWSTGDTTAAISVSKPGKYWLRATYSCGSQTVSDTVTVSEFRFPSHALTADSAICGGKPVKINAAYPGATYKWADGSTNSFFLADKPGTYEVEITLSGCSKKFSTRIGDFEKVTLPNIFTPNADGHNDAFTPLEMCGIASATLKIFNRWGQLLFTTSDIAQGWNGRINGSKSADGVYYYLLEYTNFRNEEKKKKGWVELVGI